VREYLKWLGIALMLVVLIYAIVYVFVFIIRMNVIACNFV